jgi:peroxiredoxin
LKILALMALMVVLVVGLTSNVCCSGVSGSQSEGNPSGGNPGVGEPDLVNGPGTIIDCDQYTGQGFQAFDPAPDFHFQDAAGATFSLSDFQGKLVMLNFWTTHCPFCKAELGHIEALYYEWQEKGVMIVTVNIGEGLNDVSAFLQDNGFSFPVLLDQAGAVAAQYGVRSIPCSFFINKKGQIIGIKYGACQSTEELAGILDEFVSFQEE